MDRDTYNLFEQLRAEFNQKVNQLAGALRKQAVDAVREAQAKSNEQLGHLATIASALQMQHQTGSSGGGTTSGFFWERGTIRIEDIPGRRTPYTLTQDIAIGSDVTSVRQESATITQEGPFVAVKRVMTFQSSYEFQSTDPLTGVVTRLPGRSNGRYRPVHSACDIDNIHNSVADSSGWFARASDVAAAVGARLPSASISLPSNTSSFRSMEFDGRVVTLVEGSGLQRSNQSVPTALWMENINTPYEQAALDFFERGDVITWQVTPNHAHNPAVGNVDGQAVFGELMGVGATAWPFVAGQYDVHEGIATPNSGTSPVQSASPADFNAFRGVTPITTDTIVRIPSGIVTIGYEGYRIYQPVGPVR